MLGRPTSDQPPEPDRAMSVRQSYAFNLSADYAIMAGVAVAALALMRFGFDGLRGSKRHCAFDSLHAGS